MMRNMRILGSRIEEKVNELGLSPDEACMLIGCTRDFYLEMTKGLIIPTYELLSHIIKCLGIPEGELINSDLSYYENEFVDAIGDFTIIEEREKILDIIEDYYRLRKVANDKSNT